MREREPLRENRSERITDRVKETRDMNVDDSDWQEVRRRKTEKVWKRTDVARNYQHFRKDAQRTTFFFTNFPDNFMAKHMLNAFLKYGEFEEVVIPAKRDKLGKRFGFARAVDVVDPERFAVKLDNIIIGSEKIMVNLPRFSRSSNAESKKLTNHPIVTISRRS